MKRSGILRSLVLVLPGVMAAAACDRPEWVIDHSLVTAGTSSVSGGSGTIGGTLSFGGTPVDQCAFDRVQEIKPIFGSQTVNGSLPARQELYALVSDAEAEALREGGPLIPEADPLQPPDVVKLLDKVKPFATDPRKEVIDALKPRFAAVRTVWPNPWALRLVEHAASEHMNVVRIVLRTKAWFGRIVQGSVAVTDLSYKNVGPDDVKKAPENVAAIFYEINQGLNLGMTADACEDGRRVMVIGSEDMIEEWSLATPEILERTDADLVLLQDFFKVARLCTSFDRSPTFRSFTVCQTWGNYNVYSEYTAYQWALATPNELYKPSPQNLAGLIEALQADRFEPDAYSVRPPEPPPVGGAGNEAGAGGAPAGGAGGQAGAP